MYKIAFYKLENYHQCPLRVQLMEHFGYKGKLFLPQFIGLIAHEYYERLICRWAGVEEPFDLETVVDKILRDRDPAFSREEGLKAWEKQPRDLWEEHLLRLLEGEQKGQINREHEGWKPLSDDAVLHGFCDILIERENEREIVDLKFTRKKHRYNYNQLMVYSYLFDAGKVSFLFFEPNGDVEKQTIEITPDNAKLKRLLGEMSWLAKRIGDQNFSGFRPKHGSTCHPNRCAMWDFCPEVQIGKDGKRYEEHSEWEGLEGLSAESELCTEEEQRNA